MGLHSTRPNVATRYAQIPVGFVSDGCTVVPGVLLVVRAQYVFAARVCCFAPAASSPGRRSIPAAKVLMVLIRLIGPDRVFVCIANLHLGFMCHFPRVELIGTQP